jgi:glutaredoxin-like YruB-family protein
MKNITIYSTATCHFCKLAKEFMTANNISFTEYNVGTDLERRKEMVEKSGQMGVPVIDVGGKILVGFEEGEFKEALGI